VTIWLRQLGEADEVHQPQWEQGPTTGKYHYQNTTSHRIASPQIQGNTKTFTLLDYFNLLLMEQHTVQNEIIFIILCRIPELLSFITVVASWNRNIHLSMDWLVHLGRYWYKILGNRGEGYSHVNFRPNRYKKS